MSVNINAIILFFFILNVNTSNEQPLKIQTSNLKPKIEYELYKALVGETVRLECPQSNPTWFFRKFSDSSSINNVEDIIVTRHGIINSDYKYKIMCHMTLKHKVILINNIDFGEEGLYTCLYTLPSESISKTDQSTNLVQFRYVFNVTVYTLLNGLRLNYMPNYQSAILKNSNHLSMTKSQNQAIELIENSLTVKEGDEFSIMCIVDSSKPAAEIKFLTGKENDGKSKNEILSLNYNHHFSYLTLPPPAQKLKLSSLISENSNYSKNNDYTFKTIHKAMMKANRDDNGRTLICIAENGFSKQNREIKKTLNVLYAPVCKDPPNFVYFVGINQTLSVECRILSANPSRITFDWNLDNLKKNYRFKEAEHFDFSVNSDFMLNNNFFATKPNLNMKREAISFENNDLKSKFKWKPIDSNQFGRISCKATNEIGSTECSYEIKLGGIPNPPTDCTYTLKNSTAIISCVVGFHQGDPDIYCYLLKKSENEVYKEHTRNRESCSFIVNDVNLNKLNEFWIYSSNKYGHNKDIGFHLSIGKEAKPSEPESNKNMILIGIITFVFIFCIISCCFCFRVKKGLTEETESVSDHEPYNKNNFYGIKEKQISATGLIKGVKNCQDFDKSYSDKFYKIDFSNDYLHDTKKSDSNVKIISVEYEKDRKKKSLNNDKTTFAMNKKYAKTVQTNIDKSVSLLNEMKESVNSNNQKTNFNSNNEINIDNKKNSHEGNFSDKIQNSENITNTTISTSISGSSDTNEPPNLYFDSDCADSYSFVKNKLTVSDQSFNLTSKFLHNSKFNRLSTFSDQSCKSSQSPRCFINNQVSYPSASSPNQESTISNKQYYSAKLSDSFDGKMLNKLCEDIEVSLNVDCADDYSINDFSGDYSFDNGTKTSIYSSVSKRQCLHGQKIPEIKSEINNLNKDQSYFNQNNSEFASFKKISPEKKKNLHKNNMGILV